MAVELVLTERMIDCFHSCAKKADYRKLFDKYSWIFDKLVKILEELEFPASIFEEHSFLEVISKNSCSLLNILRQWHTSQPSFCKKLLDMEERYPDFIAHFREFGSVKDWNNFYMDYKFRADSIIRGAKRLKLLDFKIECKGILFDDFDYRDKFLEHIQKLRNELSQTIKELKLSEEKLKEDGQKLRNELVELMNRKLAHFTSSFNEKFNSLGEQFDLKQLDKKIEALSIKNSSEEDLNQFLAKIGDKFNEQQAEMNRRVDQIDRKMEKMMEMLIQTAATVGSASPGTQIIAPVQNNVTDTSQIALPQDANIIESSAPQSDPTECMIHPPVQTATSASVDHEPVSEDDELQKMEDQFQKDLAEQTRVYGEKLRIAQERRREMNERAEEERNRISENLQRAASFRRSFH